MSLIGTSATWYDVWLQSAERAKADIEQLLLNDLNLRVDSLGHRFACYIQYCFKDATHIPC
jgi:hypothetical protein